MNERVCKNCGEPIYFCEQCEIWHHEITNQQCKKAELLKYPKFTEVFSVGGK